MNRPYRFLSARLASSLFSGLVILSWLLSPSALQGAEETRTWRDRSGKFEVKAALERVRDDKVVLKKPDGKTLTVPLDKLSQKDRDYVKNLSSENPFAEDDDPFADDSSENSTRKKSDSASSESSGSFLDGPLKRINFNSALEGGGQTDTSWVCEPDPSQVDFSGIRLRPVSLDFGKVSTSDIHVKNGGFQLYSHKDAPRVLAVTVLEAWGGRNKNTALNASIVHVGDMKTGRAAYFKVPQRLHLFGVSPDGTRAVLREDSWDFSDSGKKGRIYVVSIDDMKLRPLATYEPFAVEGGNRGNDRDRDVRMADWVDDRHLMIQSEHNLLVVVDVESNKAVWKISGEHRLGKCFLSPGKRYCLLSGFSGTFMLESMTGDSVGKLEGIGRMNYQNFAFSPDGKTIATIGDDGVMIWDATTGKPEEPFYIGKAVALPDLVWANERFLLVEDRLIDVQSKSLVWQYDFIGRPHQLFGKYCWYLIGHGRDPKRLLAVTIPHQTALLASRAPESKRFCIRPGMEVSLKIDSSVGNGRSNIQKRMEQIIEENELILKPDADITMFLKVSQEKEQETNYGVGHGPFPRFGGGGGTDVKYRPAKFSIEFQQGGKVLWSLSHTTGAPSHISLDKIQNDSIQGVVSKAINKANSEYEKWFTNVKIPQKIPNKEGFGRSELTITGIRDVK